MRRKKRGTLGSIEVKTCRNEDSSSYGEMEIYGKQGMKTSLLLLAEGCVTRTPHHSGNIEQSHSSPFRAKVPHIAGGWTTHSGFMGVLVKSQSECVHLFPAFM